MKVRSKKILGLVAWIIVTFAAPVAGAFFGPDEWFAGLAKPAWNPPSWLFGPVWTILYTFMAIAAWLVWKDGGFGRRRVPLALFLAQLAVNATWTPVFFGLHAPGPAFAVIVLLWIGIAATLVAFGRVHRTAAGLLVPYLAWVTFAAALNFAIWRLNP